MLPAAFALGGGFFGVAAGPLAGIFGAFLAVLLYRPHAGSPGVAGWACAVLAIAPFAALLPVAFFGEPLWRAAIVSATPFPLSATWAPNMFGVLREIPVHLAVVGLLVWAMVGSSRRDPAPGLRWGAAGLAGLISCVLVFQRWDSGFWQGPYGEMLHRSFGTRNQAASFAALALVAGVSLGMAPMGGRKRRLWFLCAFAGLAGILALASRGAVLAAAAGLGVAILRMRLPVTRTGLTAALCVAAILVGAVSSPLGRRLLEEGGSGWGRRMDIQKDAWAVLAANASQGVGVGNFGEVFSFYRSASADGNEVRHPESDWLWFACETGLVSGLAAIFLGGLFAWRWLRCGDAALSACGLGCLVALFAHGALDVPMHSPGVAFLAVPLCAIGSGRVKSRGRTDFFLPLTFAVLLLAEAGIFLGLPKERPMDFSPHRPISRLPEIGEVEEWLKIYPLDARALEIWGHSAVRSGNPDGYRAIRAVLMIQPLNDDVARRAEALAREMGDEGERAEFAAARERLLSPRNHP